MTQIKPEGPLNAKIMLVGSAPGLIDIREKRPFVGGDGKILNSHLRNAGIFREDCRITTLISIRPKGGNFSNFSPEIVEEGKRRLFKEIEKVKPNIVVAFGAEPLKALTGLTNPLKRRGSVYWQKELKTKILATVSPDLVMRSWELSPLLTFDLKKAKKESNSLEYNPLKRVSYLNPTFEQACDWLKSARIFERISIDLETLRSEPGKTALISCFAVAISAKKAMCIPLLRGGKNRFSLEEEAIIFLLLDTLMQDGRVKKIMQNAQFDAGLLKWHYGIETKGLVLDTMCAFHTVYPELPKSLDTILSIYTDQPYYGEYVGETGFWEYNCLDAMVTLESSYAIEDEMKEFKVYDFYYKHIHPLISVLTDMQIRGIKIDEKAREKAVEVLEIEFKSAQDILGDINVNSPKQLEEYLYTTLGLKPSKRTRTKSAMSTDSEALKALRRQHPEHLEIFKAIETARSCRKLISTYLTVPLYKGRMHSSFNIGGRIKGDKGDIISGPSTGRLSSSKSIIVGSGGNEQNIPKGDCRRSHIPDEGMRWMSIDLEQAEARVVAYLAQEKALINAFERGEDIHTLVAKWVFEKEDINPDERYFAKKHVHALNYGEGPLLFAALTDLPTYRAKEIIALYFRAFPGIPARQKRVQAELGKSRIMATPFGRKRMFFGRWGNSLFKQAYAYEPQSTVADVLNLALVELDKDPNIELLLNVHDEIDLQYFPEKEEEVIKSVRKAFKISIPIRGNFLEIPIKIETGINWNDLEEI